jgi:hypothetical protein
VNLKLLAWIALPIIGLVLVGWLAAWLIGTVLSALSWVLGTVFYLVLGAAAVGVAIWGWSKIRTKLAGPSTRRQIR